MAKRRKSSTGGSIAVPAPPNESESVRISKIKNGFLIERSGVKRGKYFSHQEYSPGKPVIAASIPTAKAEKRAAAPHAPRAPGKPVALREVGFLRNGQ